MLPKSTCFFHFVPLKPSHPHSRLAFRNALQTPHLHFTTPVRDFTDPSAQKRPTSLLLPKSQRQERTRKNKRIETMPGETPNGTQPETPPNFWGYMPEEEYYTSQGVRNAKEYFETPNGKLFTQSFLPLDQKVKATVYMTHGYGSDTGWMFQKICMNFATWGYAVFAADLLGHGRSDGIRCYLGMCIYDGHLFTSSLRMKS